MAARLRLREARLKYGAKQAEVAPILGVSVSSYSMMESGTRTTSGDKIAKLARFYGCSADELLGTGAWEAHDMQLARALNEYIAELGMRQVDVCRKSGLSDAHVSQLFSGKIRDPKVSVVRKVAQAMGISVDDLLDRAESYRE